MKKLMCFLILLVWCVACFAQEPTMIGAGGTWSTARSIINTNMTQVYDSFALHLEKIGTKSAKINPVFSGIVKISTDTVATQSYIRQFFSGKTINGHALTSAVTIGATDVGLGNLLNVTQEPALGNPSVDGYILSSTTAGVRSWIAPPSGTGGSMTWPATGGIPIYNGSSAWGTSIPDNHTNWDAAADAISDTVSFLTRSISLSLTFGLGSGQSADSVIFSPGALCGSWLNVSGDTITVTGINGVIAGSNSPSVIVQFYSASSLAVESPSALHTSNFTITSTTTGDSFSTFSGTSNIEPNDRLWCKIISTGKKPTYLEITLTYIPK